MNLSDYMQRSLPAMTVVRERTDDEKIAAVMMDMLRPLPPAPQPFSLVFRVACDVDNRPKFYYGMDLATGSDDEDSDG